jgi:hypothetical protein
VTLEEALAVWHYYEGGRHSLWVIGPESRVLDEARRVIKERAEHVIAREVAKISSDT